MTDQIINPEQIVGLGEKLYQEKLKSILEPGQIGRFVAIDVVSGEYFVGDTIIEAVQEGQKKYPDRLFHTMKIGYGGIYKMGSYVKNLSYGWHSK